MDNYYHTRQCGTGIIFQNGLILLERDKTGFFCFHYITKTNYNLFILVMCILLQRDSNSRDLLKYISGKMSL